MSSSCVSLAVPVSVVVCNSLGMTDRGPFDNHTVRRDIARRIASDAQAMQKMATEAGLDFLAYLLAMTTAEAHERGEEDEQARGE